MKIERNKMNETEKIKILGRAIVIAMITSMFMLVFPMTASAATGDDCTDPIVVSISGDLPYTDTGQTTCGRVDDYDATCLGSYDGGEDIIYRLDVTADTCIDIEMDPKGTTWTGLMIDDNCPGDDSSCIDYDTGSSGTRELLGISLTAGNSYYIMVDTYPSPDCISDFDLTITECAGPSPGDDCTNPIYVDIPADLTYTNASYTCGRGNDYSSTCLGSYDGGEDIIYQLNVNSDTTINVTLDPKTTTYTGILIDDECPDTGVCINSSTNTGANPHGFTADLTVGTYYIMVDTWPSPACIPDFSLTIEEMVQPCLLEIEKKVYNGTAWVDEISDAQLGNTYRFRINVTSINCNFTEAVVKDTLSSSLTYEDNASPFEPNSTVGNVRYWNFSALDKGETKTIEFDVNANTYGYGCNVANVTANCTDTGGIIHTAEDNACLNIAPLSNTFDAVWDNTDDVASTLTEDIFDICTANDLDEDGSQEILTGDQNGNVTVFENTGNDQYTDVWHVTPDGNDILAVCVCDLDGNGKKEIIAGGTGDTVYVYEWDGVTGSNNYLPVSSLNVGDDINDLCCSDIDSDGNSELGIACADEHAYIYSVSGAWTWNMEFDSGDVGYGVYSVLCCCDLNNNGDKEFIFAEYDYDETYIYEGTAPDTYTLRWQQKVSSSDGRPYSMVCCDMDGDGYQELYIGDSNGELIVVTNTGDLTACSYSLVHGFGDDINKLACGDEDADGMKDIYLAMDDNNINDLEFFGTDVTDYSHYLKSVIGVDLNAGNNARAVHCTDLDGDGNREVIAGYERLISYPGMKLLHVLEHSAACTLPGLDVEKTVYDPETDTWVDSISSAIPSETYRFRINVTATCCNFTDVVINDTLSPSLSYAGNPYPSAPTVIGNVYQWTFSTIDKSETKTIEFDATVSYRGNDCNLANATGWCNESVPHEQYSDEDAACINSRVDLAVKSAWNDHIRVNPGCSKLDYYRVIVNESNTIRVWVINNGPSNITAGESFDVCFDLNGVGITCETVTGPLNASEDVYFDINMTPDCTSRPEWPDYPPMPGYPSECITPGYRLNVTVDANNEINETNEGNNLGWRAVSICNNGYKSKNFDCNTTEDPLALFDYEQFYGGVTYNVSGVRIAPGDPEYCFCPGESSERVHHIDIPSGMTVKKARLYVYWYDWPTYCPSGGQVPGYLANLNVNFNGATVPRDAAYNDQKGLTTTSNYPKGTYAYDVTSEVSGSGDYTVNITNIDPSMCTIPLGGLLLVVYEDPTQNPDNQIQLWLMEGCDLLMASHGVYQYCVDVNESTATVTFPGSVAAGFTSAELITVVAQGMENGNNMLFNGDVIKTDAWNLNSEKGTQSTNPPDYDNGSNICVEVVDVTDNITSSDNTVGFQDTGTAGMQPSNAILIVHKPGTGPTPTPTPTPPPAEVPAITPPGFLLALISLFGLAAIAMRSVYKSE